MSSFVKRIALATAACAAVGANAGQAPLPSVDTVLTKANSKAQDFTAQAVAMGRRLEEQRSASYETLRMQKQQYEMLLQAQSNQSEAIKRQNMDLQSGNAKLVEMNKEMNKALQELSEKNDEKRAALRSISSKVDAARLFLEDSLLVTDDSEAKELEVLRPTTLKPTLDNFLAMTKGDTLSLLAVGGANNANDIVSMLAASLADIEAAEMEGAAELKAHFMESFRQGEKYQAELNTTQAELLQTQASLKETRAKLLDARAHLQATSQELHDRLRAVRAFAGKLDDTALESLHGHRDESNSTIANASSESAKANQTLKHNVTSTPVPAISANSTIKSHKAKTTLRKKRHSTAVHDNTTALVNDSMINNSMVNDSVVNDSVPAAAKRTSLLRKPVAKAVELKTQFATKPAPAHKGAPKTDALDFMKRWFSKQ